MDKAAFWVEIIAAMTIPICFICVVVHRLKLEKGMGFRAIQFLSLGVVLPIVLIMGLERIIESGTIGTLLGAVVGYVFSTAASSKSASSS